MNNLDRRLDRLEGALGMKRQQIYVFAPNCNELPETPYHAQVAGDVWVSSTVPMTSDEVAELREEYKKRYEQQP